MSRAPPVEPEVRGQTGTGHQDGHPLHLLWLHIGEIHNETFPDDLLVPVFQAVLKDSKVAPEDVQDICVGNVGDPRPAVSARTGQFFSGIPETTPIHSVNRQCSSGLQACMNIAGAIKTGQIDLGIGAGVESMTMHRNTSALAPLNPAVFEHDLARQVLIPMGMTSENVAEKYGITREEQDQFALLSQQRAGRAQQTGAFDKEIVPVTTKLTDKDGNEQTVTVAKDEGIRPTTLERLLKLKPAFKEGGSTTAGNSSQVSDGAAAVLMARRSQAIKQGLRVFGVVRGYAVEGCPPDIMGIGPAVAIPELLKKTGLTIDDIDVFEINEAFASQAYYTVRKLGIPSEKVNPLGGAIALGHPLGCTGARQIATLLHELERRGKRAFGVVSMCMGTGMGAACLIEYPGPA
uniref:3-ketoacyl-CoA thiolase A, peroxisomal-like isoform X2 n=1 Tax=Crassostrea virginica TaxID=6565 RepID=A0A8B8C5Y3_CRAVI|nr:3-ketoacyl-CoA thiolase A, peroxisomal-like isoform X2 [Crassostrea virginica]